MTDPKNLTPERHDIDIVSDMIERASKEGLLVEVVWKYGDYRRAGDDASTAARAALNEWDIL